MSKSKPKYQKQKITRNINILVDDIFKKYGYNKKKLYIKE